MVFEVPRRNDDDEPRLGAPDAAPVVLVPGATGSKEDFVLMMPALASAGLYFLKFRLGRPIRICRESVRDIVELMQHNSDLSVALAKASLPKLVAVVCDSEAVNRQPHRLAATRSPSPAR